MRKAHSTLPRLLPRLLERHRRQRNYKVKGNIHWVSVQHALDAEVRLYDRLFTAPNPDAGGKDFKQALNPNAKEVITAYLEQGMRHAMPDEKFQFERHGYFMTDRVDHSATRPVFNRVVTLNDGMDSPRFFASKRMCWSTRERGSAFNERSPP